MLIDDVLGVEIGMMTSFAQHHPDDVMDLVEERKRGVLSDVRSLDVKVPHRRSGSWDPRPEI